MFKRIVFSTAKKSRSNDAFCSKRGTSMSAGGKPINPDLPGISMQEIARCIAPPLSGTSHKGEHGRIGIIGGSIEYTGAPFFAAIAALKSGADLVHVFCHPDAAVVIKSYSPDLIVHPLLNPHSSKTSSSILEWMDRLHSIVIGPGLGRDPGLIDPLRTILQKAKDDHKSLIIDGDGLHFVTENPELIRGYDKAVLTPNVVEFKRLMEKLGMTDDGSPDVAANLASALGNVTIVRKGDIDVISNGRQTVYCQERGSPRRCGGQGDLLAGALGTFACWSDKAAASAVCQQYSPLVVAAYAACHVTRQCQHQAFTEARRSMTASDMVAVLPRVIQYYFSE